jgi:hypothetical protein
MRSDLRQEVGVLARGVGKLLRGLDSASIRSKPNSYEPTLAEFLALAVLELDRIDSGARVESVPVPPFASDFLNRRLSRRLLERYQGLELAAEFERRLGRLLERFNKGRPVDATGPDLQHLHHLLAELESALVQRLR